MNHLSYSRAAKEERKERVMASQDMTSVMDYLGNQRAFLREELIR